ncbi:MULTISPECIES: hypothetical protein [Acinetobacter]|nr:MULTISPECIES: hypothetical protein [Acinetobacter]
MKKIALLTFLLFGTLSNVYAKNDDLRKIQLIKKIYATELSLNPPNNMLEKNATPELKSLLNSRDRIHSRFGGEYCDWARSLYVPGNDFDTKVGQMKFTTLNNGLIRASGTSFGEKFHRDFKVQCDTSSCKIDDIYDPNSYKKEMQQLVKKPYC